MNILTRLMEPEEAQEVLSIGRRAFIGMERLFLTKPKNAVVAVKDDKIVGAVQYKFYQAGGRKIGYFDYAFIDPDYHNQGIGGILYKAAADFLWEQGCDALTASVKDDNVGSWGLFLKNGFTRVSIPELAKQFGLGGMLRHYFGTIFSIAVGMDYYAALRNQEFPSLKGGSLKQITAYLMVNFLLFLITILRGAENIRAFFMAYSIFMVGGVLAGYVGTLFSKRRWQFRLCNGGGLICALVNLMGGLYPMVGNWYPKRYENTDSFRRDMGINALAGWIFVLILSLISVLGASQTAFIKYMGQIGTLFLLYRVAAIYPFDSFGGRRVYCFKRWLYLLMSVPSLALFIVVFVL